MRIGGVALHAVDGDGAGQRAAPADLDHVAELVRIGRLADERRRPSVSPFAAAHSSSLTVPLIAGPSSSPVIRKEIEPLRRALVLRYGGRRRRRNRRCRPSCRRRRGRTSRRWRSRPKRADASRPPHRRPARHRYGRQTSDAARCPSGGHRGFRCPACRPPRRPGRSTAKPSGFSIASSAVSAPPSAGVTDGQRIRAARFAAGSVGRLMAAGDSGKRRGCHARPYPPPCGEGRSRACKGSGWGWRKILRR